MGAKTAYVKVAVEPERKARWEDKLSETPNVGTLSGLVRLAVEQHLEGGNRGNDAASEEIAETLSELVEQNREVVNNLDRVQGRLGSIESSVKDDPEIAELASDVFAVLPTKEQFEDDALPDRLPEEQGGPYTHSGEVADIAAVLDASELLVREALDKLQADTARVRSEDGRYWKEV